MIPAIYLCVTGCQSTSKAGLEKLIEEQRQIMPPDSLLKKLRAGTDFFASGSDPVPWQLDMDFDKIILFSAGDGNTLQLRPAFEKLPSENDPAYQLRSDPGTVTIRVNQHSCTAGPGASLQKSVDVTIGEKKYTGCGNYLFDHRLHDTWQLDMINQEKITKKSFPGGLPYLQLDLRKGKLTGSDGCKKISGSVEVQGNRIRFGTFSPGNSSCKDDRVAKIFSEKVSAQPVSYYEENGRLVLYLIDDSKLIFTRKSL